MRTSIQAAMAAINLYSEYFLGLIVSLTIARSLSTSDYGLYSSIILIAAWITLAINSGLAINVTKFVAEFNKKDKSALPAILAYFSRIQNIRLLVVTLVAIIIFIFSYGETKIPFWLWGSLFICATIKADYMYRMAIFKGIKRFDVLAKTSLLANPFNIVAVILCAYFNATLENFVLVYCAACLIYGISTRIFGADIPKSKWDDSVISLHKKRIFYQVLAATGIVFLGALIFRQSQVIFLEKNDFLSEAGFFNIAFLLSTAAITLIPGIYQEILLPRITDAVEDGDVQVQIAQAERYLITLSLLVVFPVVIYAEVIIEVLYGVRYQDAVLPLQLMMIFKTILTLSQGANLTLISHDQQVPMVKAKIGIFIFAFAISSFCVTQWGLNGALFCYGILAFVLLFTYSWLAKNCGYRMLSLKDLSRIVLAALLAIIPVFLLNLYVVGILAAILGSLVFFLLFVHILFITKGYDDSVRYILKQIKPKLPMLMQRYVGWGIKRLS